MHPVSSLDIHEPWTAPHAARHPEEEEEEEEMAMWLQENIPQMKPQPQSCSLSSRISPVDFQPPHNQLGRALPEMLASSPHDSEFPESVLIARSKVEPSHGKTAS